MAKREVVEVTCDRCGKTETQTKDEINTESRPEFTGQSWDPKTKTLSKLAKYDDLCKKCRRAVGNYFVKIIKVDEEEDSKTRGN
jgi:hypothetical protein